MDDKVSVVIKRVKDTGLFDLQAGIEYCMDEEGYVDILEQSPYTFESCLENLCKFYDLGISPENEANITEYRVVAHSIKSSARLLGYNTLFEIGKTSEFAARDMDVDLIVDNHPVLVDKTNEAIELIREFFVGADEGQSKETVTDEELKKILNGMIEAAEDFDLDGMDDGVERLKSVELPEAIEILGGKLASAVANIDTDAIAEIANAMLEAL